MFCSVAFAGWNGGAARPSVGWELPTMSGERLRVWAANLARRVVARHARQPRSAETPLSIATELEAGANAVLEQAAHQTHSEVAKTCPNTRPHQIAVTAPEVFGIVDELERRYSKPEIQMVRELAVLNARRGRFVISEEFAQAGIKCPLQTQDGHCLTFTNRPLACRRLCSDCACPANGCNDRCKDSTATSSPDVVVQLHDGMTAGLSEGLRQAGLDDGTYELNDALAIALATPHAAARWSRGEAVFANCAKA
jgi:hypothetical protein